MASMRAGLVRKGIDPERIHYEVFGPGAEVAMQAAA